MSIKEEEGHKLLHHEDKLYIPQSLIQKILVWTHNMYQHPGSTRFADIVKHTLFWDTLFKDTKKYSNSCLICKRNKLQPIQYGIRTPTTIHDNIQPFEFIAVDVQGPLPLITDNHGVEYRFIFSIIDIESRWVELIPLPDHQASTLCDALDNQ